MSDMDGILWVVCIYGTPKDHLHTEFASQRNPSTYKDPSIHHTHIHINRATLPFSLPWMEEETSRSRRRWVALEMPSSYTSCEQPRRGPEVFICLLLHTNTHTYTFEGLRGHRLLSFDNGSVEGGGQGQQQFLPWSLMMIEKEKESAMHGACAVALGFEKKNGWKEKSEEREEGEEIGNFPPPFFWRGVLL